MRWWARVSGGAAALGFLLLTLIAHAHHTWRVDDGVLRLMQRLRGVPYARLEQHRGQLIQTHPTPALAGVARVLGVVGTPAGAIVGLALLVVLAWRRSPPRAVALVFLFGAAALIEQLCKTHVAQFEPGVVTSFYPYAYQFSYPSGHALAAFFFAVAAGFLLRRRWVWYLGLALAALVALSRIYVGDHWLSDVIGGGMLGWCAAAAAFAV